MLRPLVTPEWLNENRDDPEVIILDASAQSNKSGIKTDYDGLTIKGARLFDLKNTFSDQNNDLPNMLPSSSHFEIECRKLGIKQSSKIIVYDNLGIYNSPRVWWMFNTMGYKNISVLDGGLPQWIEKGYPAEAIVNKKYELGDFESHFNPNSVKDFQFVRSNIETSEAVIIDARSSGRFKGTALEPRLGLKSGHIPNSKNIPFTNVLSNGEYKSVAELREVFRDLSSETKELVFSCGSGITACIILLACELVLENKKSIYDGSWTEWSKNN